MHRVNTLIFNGIDWHDQGEKYLEFDLYIPYLRIIFCFFTPKAGFHIYYSY